MLPGDLVHKRSALGVLLLVAAASLLPIASSATATVPAPSAATAGVVAAAPKTAAETSQALTSQAAAAAAAAVNPVRTRVYDGGLLGGGYASSVSTEAFAGAAVGNVTGHRDGDTDVVGAYVDGSIHVWSQRTGRQEYVVQTGGAIRATPSLVRLRAGGGLLVLTANRSGDVLLYAFTAGTPQLLFHKHMAMTGNNGFFGTPTLANLDRNGKMYIVATSFDQHLYVWDLQGNNKPGFPIFVQDTIWSSPTVAVLDGDIFPQIIFGYDCGGSGAQTCYQRWHNRGGVLTVIKHDGKVAPGFPVFISGQVVWSTPAVASLYGTSAKQIVVGTGLFWPNAGYATYVFDARGHRLMTVPMSGRTFSSPAVGDVMGTGRPQIVIGTEDGYTDIIDGAGKRLSHVCTATLSSCVQSHSSPIIGDLYGNGQQEVVAVGANGFHIIDRTGKSVVFVQIPETVLGLAASPTLVNIDNRATLFFSLMARGPGGNHAEVISYTFPTKAGPSAWPTFKNEMSRMGSSTKVVPAPPG